MVGGGCPNQICGWNPTTQNNSSHALGYYRGSPGDSYTDGCTQTHAMANRIKTHPNGYAALKNSRTFQHETWRSCADSARGTQMGLRRKNPMDFQGPYSGRTVFYIRIVHKFNPTDQPQQEPNQFSQSRPSRWQSSRRSGQQQWSHK